MKRATPGEASRPANPHGAPDGVQDQSAWRDLMSGVGAYVRARTGFQEADAAPGGAGRASGARKTKAVQSVWVLAHPPTVDPVPRLVTALHARGVGRIVAPPLHTRGKARLQAWMRHVLTTLGGAQEARALLVPMLGQYASGELDAIREGLGALYVAGAKSVPVATARRQAALPLVLITYATPAASHTRGAFGRVSWARQLTLWPERSPPSSFRAFAERRARELGARVPQGASGAMPVHVSAFLELQASGLTPPPLPWVSEAPATGADASYGLALHSQSTPTGDASELLRAAVAVRPLEEATVGSEWGSGVFARHLWWHALLTLASARDASGDARRRAIVSSNARRACALQAADSATRGALARGGSGVTTRGVGLSDDLMRAVHGAAEARLRLGLAAAGATRRTLPGLHPGLSSGMRYRRDFTDATRAGDAARNNARLVWTRVLRDTGGLVFCPDLEPCDAEVPLEDVTRCGGGPAIAGVLDGMCGVVGLPAERWGGREFVSVRYGKAAAAHI